MNEKLKEIIDEESEIYILGIEDFYVNAGTEMPENDKKQTRQDFEKGFFIADAIGFADYVGGRGFYKQDVYKKYSRDEYDKSICPDLDSFIETRWSIHPIDEIMLDNDNSELDWVLKNSYTTEELYITYLTSKINI
jgi:hypothetical protein